MNKIIDDIANLTSLPKNMSKEIVPIMESAVAHRVFESVLSGNTVTEINLGVGMLYIKNEGSSVKYRFVPSKKMEEEVAKVLVTKTSPIERKLEQSLLTKLENAYKGLV